MKTIRSLFPKKEAGSYTNAGIVFVLSVVLFLGLTMPFRLRLAAADITDMRTTTALTPGSGSVIRSAGGSWLRSGESDLRLYFRIWLYLCPDWGGAADSIWNGALVSLE